MDSFTKPLFNLFGLAFTLVAIGVLARIMNNLSDVLIWSANAFMWAVLAIIVLFVAYYLLMFLKGALKGIWIRVYFKYFYKF